MWWLVFSVPLVKNCEQTSGKPYKKGDVGASIKNVFTTMKEIGADKPMLIYIISYFFYIDGVHTIISMSTSYGTTWGWTPPVCCWRCCWCRCWACRSAYST